MRCEEHGECAEVQVYARTSGAAQEWARNLLTTVGRGGNAQAVRDEILNVMHRNKVRNNRQCVEECAVAH